MCLAAKLVLALLIVYSSDGVTGGKNCQPETSFSVQFEKEGHVVPKNFHVIYSFTNKSSGSKKRRGCKDKCLKFRPSRKFAFPWEISGYREIS